MSYFPYSQDSSIEGKFQQYLFPGEKILWAGQPDMSNTFEWPDAIMMPFGAVWCGSGIYGLARSVSDFFRLPTNVIGLETIIMPILVFLGELSFVGAGGLIFFGRPVYRKWLKKHTYYAVTNSRVLIVRELFRRTVKPINISSIQHITKFVRGKGVGTIVLGHIWFPIYPTIDTRRYGYAPALFDIPNVEEVYRMLQSLRQGQSYS